MADTTHNPTYTDPDLLAQAIQGLHISEMLGYDDDGADDQGVNDIDISLMTPEATYDDFHLGGSPELQSKLRSLIAEFPDIFSYSVKGKAMNVPPMEFKIDKERWEIPANHFPSRHISTEKHTALNKLIDELLELGVIQPSKAAHWSHVHLVRKPGNGGWRFTVDYRSLNKVISNEGWQIPNMKEMLTRIGAKHPKIFGVADLTQGFFQMPLHDACRAPTACICFRGVFEWTRVPMGLLPSANFFQKSMSYYVLRDVLYHICEVSTTCLSMGSVKMILSTIYAEFSTSAGKRT
jgi:hypothetical protein